jgi:hypothetical protein
MSRLRVQVLGAAYYLRDLQGAVMTMNPYIKSKLVSRAPVAPGQLTAADFGALALAYLKRRQEAAKTEIKPLPEADRVDSLTGPGRANL